MMPLHAFSGGEYVNYRLAPSTLDEEIPTLDGLALPPDNRWWWQKL